MKYPKFRFYLLGKKGYRVLSKVLAKYGNECVESVVYSTDKNIKEDCSTEIKQLCTGEGISFSSKNEVINGTDLYSFAIGWRWIIDPGQVKNLIILHDSILPKYRGFNPLVSALLNGDTKIGVTALYASQKYDQGDIILQSIKDIKYPININDAIEIISDSYCELVITIMDLINNGQKLPRHEQEESKASYSLWRDEEDYQINWNWDSSKIIRFINATGFPYRGASSLVDGEKIRILEATEIKDVKIENRTVGKVIFLENSNPVVVCGKGLLKLTKMNKDVDNKVYNLKKFRVKFK